MSVALFRVTYQRLGRLGSMTFAVEDSLFALEEAEFYAQHSIMAFARAMDPEARLIRVHRVQSKQTGERK